MRKLKKKPTKTKKTKLSHINNLYILQNNLEKYKN